MNLAERLSSFGDSDVYWPGRDGGLTIFRASAAGGVLRSALHPMEAMGWDGLLPHGSGVPTGRCPKRCAPRSAACTGTRLPVFPVACLPRRFEGILTGGSSRIRFDAAEAGDTPGAMAVPMHSEASRFISGVPRGARRTGREEST